jgi:transcriptional regulator with XRE-family HTH domain
LTLPRKTKGGPSDYDVSIGQRVRMQRSLLGWSQEKLATALGITFQQVQKYENGVNRISAGRLYELSVIMGVPITTFFIDVAMNTLSDQPQAAFQAEDPMTSKETGELLRAYYAIDDVATRKQILALAKSLAEGFAKKRA